MVVDELRRAIELAQQQSEEEQRQIARLILEELEDREWESSPELAAAFTEAREEVADGDVMDFEEYDQARQARELRAQ